MPTRTKAEIIADLTAFGITECFGTPLSKISVTELEALLEVQNKGEDEDYLASTDKVKENPMTGLDRLSRKELEKVVYELSGDPAMDPTRFRNKGQIMLKIREKLTVLETTKINIGKNRGRNFADLKNQTSYLRWLQGNCNHDSHPELQQIYMYMQLWHGLVKHDPKKEEPEEKPTTSSKFPEDEPFVMVEAKGESQARSSKDVKPKVEPKMKKEETEDWESRTPPIWDGKEETFELYKAKLQYWVTVQDKKLKGTTTMSDAVRRKVPEDDGEL